MSKTEFIRAILIDTPKAECREIMLPAKDTFAAAKAAIGCETGEIVNFDDGRLFIIDEEGLLNPNNESFFYPPGEVTPIAGKAIFTHMKDPGSENERFVSVHMPTDIFAAFMRFSNGFMRCIGFDTVEGKGMLFGSECTTFTSRPRFELTDKGEERLRRFEKKNPKMRESFAKIRIFSKPKVDAAKEG